MGDPSGHVYEGKLFIYGKQDRRCRENSNDTSWTCFSTTNLEDWTNHKSVFSIYDVPWAKGHAFAPDAAGKNGKYYMYGPALDSSGNWRTAVGISSNPSGPFTYHGQINVEEYDPSVFIDDNGQSYIYYPGRMAKLNEDMVSIKGDWMSRSEYLKSGPLDTTNHAIWENPFVFKRKGKYYYLLSVFNRNEKGKADWNKGQTVYHWISDSPTGPFEYKGPIFTPSLGNTGTSIVKYKGKWLFFAHDFFRTPKLDCVERKPCMYPVEFKNDGTIKYIENTAQKAVGN